MSYTQDHLAEVGQIASQLDTTAIDRMVALLADLRTRQGRLFFLGVGGSAANCSHAVNDFRKIAGIEAYAPTDNVSELTARTNDEGWASVFVEWLKGSHLNAKDMIFVLSVGGGNLEKNVSPNLVTALQYAKQIGAQVVGILGRDGGFTAQVADAYVIVPTVDAERITPHAEAFQGVIWHLLVSHPALKIAQTKWEIDALMRRAVFLDRDGVINRALVREGRPYPPLSIAELDILPGVPDALSRLRASGFLLIVVTNQPDVARGTISRQTVEAMHDRLRTELPLDELRACYHDDADHCHCRKPAPGMLLDGAQDHDIDLAASFMVGDRWRDIEAGQRAGCTTLFIDYGYTETSHGQPNVVVKSLSEAADWILAHTAPT